jgi:hypothetical protein
MSHFTTLVLLKNPEDIEEEVAVALAPFDENIEVAEYERDCHCIGQVAEREAREKAIAKFGSINDLRKSFKGETDEEWKEHIKPYTEYLDKLKSQHPMKDKPDPECGFYLGEYWESEVETGKLDKNMLGQRYEDGSGCGGTGRYFTTYNPNSKWDWYEIGGRWQGDLDPNYERIKDERNYKTCKCNVCHGTGKALKFQLAPHDEGNIRPVSEILDYCPFAILTPDGHWCEKGEIGWWGIVTDEEDNWPAIAKRILQENQNCIAVLCDLHI